MLALTWNIAAAQWTSLGPDGGDARTLAYDPQNPERILLGTSGGALFESSNGGHSWSLVRQSITSSESVIDSIVFDHANPSTVYAGVWSVESDARGGVLKSEDGGHSWRSLTQTQDKSVRAIAVAPSSTSTVVMGAVQGLFRSDDAGESWRQIRSPSSGNIKNIQSLMIHPGSTEVIFAGTWHLPWRSLNGGLTWSLINDGIDDDSDIFSIVADSSRPWVIYVGACSGIYKSVDLGAHFRKLGDLPFSARRTRVLRQDPSKSTVIYAGTTEGLWRTTDAGQTWSKLTGPEVVVNDVMIDPRNSDHVLVATDRIGVLSTEDGGRSFTSSNRGFFHRQLRDVAAGPSSNTLFGAVINAKEFGGVFALDDAGTEWRQVSAGLGGRDVFSLQQTRAGILVAGTQDGLFVLQPGTLMWQPVSALTSAGRRGNKVVRDSRAEFKLPLMGRIFQVRVISSGQLEQWIAASAEGLFWTFDAGKVWARGAILNSKDLTSADVSGETIIASNSEQAFLSGDSGVTWMPLSLPPNCIPVLDVRLARDAAIWIISGVGVFRSSDAGITWQHITATNQKTNLSYLTYSQDRLIGLAESRDKIFESLDEGKTWTLITESPRPLQRVVATRDSLLGLTEYDGIISHPLAPTAAAARVNGSVASEAPRVMQ